MAKTERHPANRKFPAPVVSTLRAIPRLVLVFCCALQASAFANMALALCARPAPSALVSAVAQQSTDASQDRTEQKSSPGATSTAAAPASGQPLDLDEAVAHDVLEPLQTGIQIHSLKEVLSVLDPQSMSNYAEVRDQFRALFSNYSVLQFRYKLLQLSSERNRVSAMCEIDMDATPADENLMAVRRSAQMRFQLKQTSTGWKIVDFSPSDFFAQ